MIKSRKYPNGEQVVLMNDIYFEDWSKFIIWANRVMNNLWLKHPEWVVFRMSDRVCIDKAPMNSLIRRVSK